MRSACKPERLQALLEERNMSMQTLARLTEIPVTTIRAYLHGRRDAISTRNMFLIARTLDMPMSELVDYLSEAVNIDKK